MSVEEILRTRREEIRRIAASHGAKNIFDLLIDAEPVTSSWFPAGLILDLEDLLGRRVDVVTERGLNPLIRDRVLREAVPL